MTRNDTKWYDSEDNVECRWKFFCDSMSTASNLSAPGSAHELATTRYLPLWALTAGVTSMTVTELSWSAMRTLYFQHIVDAMPSPSIPIFVRGLVLITRGFGWMSTECTRSKSSNAFNSNVCTAQWMQSAICPHQNFRCRQIMGNHDGFL